MTNNQSNYERYLQTYAGKRLITKHSLDEEGTWEIKGEDPNCDFGGLHHQPSLGFRTGKLRDVIEEAVEMSSFWQWGAGSDIRKIEVLKADVNSVQRLKILKDRRVLLENELNQIKKQLGE